MQLATAQRSIDWAINKGGIGTPDDKILYDQITKDTFDSEDGYQLTLQLYYKTREKRELHGNLLLTTKDLPDNVDVKFGFLMTEDQTEGQYDGMHVETQYITRYLESDDFQFDFRGFDIWTRRRPDIIQSGATVFELPPERLQDFNINPVKCFKECDEQTGICRFNAHFWRYFETGDGSDIQLSEDDDKVVYMMGYFEVQDSEYDGKRQLGAGMGDDIKVKVGRIKDYEEEMSGAVANSLATVATVVGLMTMALF